MRTLHKTLAGAIGYLKDDGWYFQDGFWWKDETPKEKIRPDLYKGRGSDHALALSWDHNLRMWQLTVAV